MIECPRTIVQSKCSKCSQKSDLVKKKSDPRWTSKIDFSISKAAKKKPVPRKKQSILVCEWALILLLKNKNETKILRVHVSTKNKNAFKNQIEVIEIDER